MTNEKTTFQTSIVHDPEVLGGKPVVKGTRIPVDLVLAYLARNPDFGELFTDYPRLTLDDVKACLAFASAVVEETEHVGRNQQRETFFDRWEAVAKRVDLPGEEAMALARDAVQAVRAARRA